MQYSERFSYMAAESPALKGELRGSSAFPDAAGVVLAYALEDGLYLRAELSGLPADRVFGFHVHEGIICGEADGSEPFAAAGGHLSACPEGTWCNKHPYHTGDLPPVFSDSSGYASMDVYLGKADTADYSGKPIILHAMPDDLRSQPSGSSGARIACGIFAEIL